MEAFPFEDQFPKITEEQFCLASSILDKLQTVIGDKVELADKNLMRRSLVEPNFIWEQIRLFSYCYNKPSYGVINTWRLHTYLFSGNHLLPFIGAAHNILPKNVLKRYLRETAGLPSKFVARPPRICGECGWEINGGIVNDDVLMYQRHLRTLYFSGIIDYLQTLPRLTILEIGGGYGGLAYFLKQIFPHARYYMIDLPESLAFPAVYLQITLPQYVNENSVYGGSAGALDPKGQGFTFVPNVLLWDLDGVSKFDLVVNTGSFGEMKRDQVREYADFIYKNMASSGLLYEDNHQVIYDSLKYDEDPSVLIPLATIFAERFLCLPLDYKKKAWTENKETVCKIRDCARSVDASQPLVARSKRKALEWCSRNIQNLPGVKRVIRKIIGF